MQIGAFRLGISERRRNWIIEWIGRILNGDVVEADYDSGLGRLSFVCGAIVYDRPFLAPLYAFAAKVRSRTGRKVDLKKLPPYIKLTLKHLHARLSSRHTIDCRMGKTLPGRCNERFRTDAKAEGDLVVIGGYQTRDGLGRAIPHEAAKWFMLTLNRESAAWAFAKGEPYQAIASLELLGTLLGVILLLDGDECPELRSGCAVSVGGLTDNRGNKFAVAKMLTTKWPLAAFVAEMAAQLELREILLEVEWVPRELNAEADSITNGHVEWLTPSMQLEVTLAELPFLVLNELLAEGSKFYEGLDNANVMGEEHRPTSKTLLKVRDPWD